jgi:acylphosphatase
MKMRGGDGMVEGGGGARVADGDKVSVHVVFSGIVQGVFFRASTRREALRLGLKGWVRNLSDGTVEAWVEGSRPNIDGLIAFCENGISIARVDRVDVEEGAYTGDFPSFDIVR